MCQSRVGSAAEVSVVVVVSSSCANSSCHAIGSSRSPPTPTAKDDPELTSPHPQSFIFISYIYIFLRFPSSSWWGRDREVDVEEVHHVTNDDYNDNTDVGGQSIILFWQDHHQGDKIIRNTVLDGVDEFNRDRFAQTLPVMLWDLFP